MPTWNQGGGQIGRKAGRRANRGSPSQSGALSAQRSAAQAEAEVARRIYTAKAEYIFSIPSALMARIYPSASFCACPPCAALRHSSRQISISAPDLRLDRCGLQLARNMQHRFQPEAKQMERVLVVGNGDSWIVDLEEFLVIHRESGLRIQHQPDMEGGFALGQPKNLLELDDKNISTSEVVRIMFSARDVFMREWLVAELAGLNE
jgi:hypothetical protein